LKQVVVCAVDQGDVRGSVLQGFCSGQATEPSANYYDCRLSHVFREAPREADVGLEARPSNPGDLFRSLETSTVPLSPLINVGLLGCEFEIGRRYTSLLVFQQAF
jgi:hypothetical protein